MELINNIIINGYRGSFHPRSKLAGYSTEIKPVEKTKRIMKLRFLVTTPVSCGQDIFSS